MAKEHPLRQFRKANNLRPEDVAKRLKKSVPTIRSWENGHRKIQAEDAVLIEKELGIARCELRRDLWQKAA